nr:MAG TPA: hypothetical protein [Caudoviricetes sp.]
MPCRSNLAQLYKYYLLIQVKNKSIGYSQASNMLLK